MPWNQASSIIEVLSTSSVFGYSTPCTSAVFAWTTSINAIKDKEHYQKSRSDEFYRSRKLRRGGRQSKSVENEQSTFQDIISTRKQHAMTETSPKRNTYSID